jgi:hypothetical protein
VLARRDGTSHAPVGGSQGDHTDGLISKVTAIAGECEELIANHEASLSLLHVKETTARNPALIANSAIVS